MTEQQIYLLITLLGLYLIFFGTWIFYIAFMGIKDNAPMLKAKLGIVWYGLLPFFIIALAFDVLFNWTIGTLYFFEIPREFLFTSRCNRHINGDDEGRKAKAEQVCKYLLDPFDENHCGRK